MTIDGAGPPDFARQAINLASAGLGARPVFATDAFFAPLERMLQDCPAVFHPGVYDDHGKWMDGWETRRRRGPGHDHAIVELATAGRIAGFDVDTAHFTGNYPSACAIDACLAPEGPGETTVWTELLGMSPLGPSAHHFFPARVEGVWSHVRLRIYPDGGIARLRVYGTPELDRKWIGDQAVDLASSLLGGRIVVFSNGHYGHQRLLAPGRGINMGDGWETRRRREPGNDWIIVKLAACTSIERITVDTAHFKGNYPDACSVQAACLSEAECAVDAALTASSLYWREVLPRQKLNADSIHDYGPDLIEQVGYATHVRLNIYPDGGVSRLRVFGRIAGAGTP
ncbi:allantoicase [Sinorhizobium sp. A49]|uniref:allantoicase n=1 Tax=Sinorhizobium sp. A49 TaxID=1945861 RepID=UPI000987D3EE|nr:allantoicase [Sinorhizobium sp. A49]OOG70274.1 allantoicase [Sinorhizobium sp. A49]